MIHRTTALTFTATRLPTFTCNDVVKNPQIERYLSDYRAHLEKVFGKA